uniref:MATH domain-containing protein n=1 Tax=Lygus hesperus TaxID=30085 RepID=A0A0A9YI77_LYGHE
MENTFTHDLNGWGEREVIEKRAFSKNTGFVFDNNIRIKVRLPIDSISTNTLEEEQAIVPFVWEVPLADMNLPPGEYLLSPKFVTWNSDEYETWQLQLFPNGVNSKKKQFVAAYLVHRGAKKVDFSFTLFIANQNEENTEAVTMENVKFKYDLHGWGGNAMVKRSDIEDPEKGFLFDGKNIKIGVHLATDHISLKKTDSIMVPYTWEVKVEDLKLGTGKYILSPNITTWNGQNKETWQVQLYPHGFSSEDGGHASLFIAHRGDREVKSRWSISVVNKDSKKTESRTGTNMFGYDLQGWGSRTFIDSAKLKDTSEGFLFDGKIKIGVELPSDNITLSIDNDCPVIKEAPLCEKCPTLASVGRPVTQATFLKQATPVSSPHDSPHPSPAPINASLHNLYRELKLKTPDGSEFSINHIMSFESIEKLISNLMKLNGESSNYKPQVSVKDYKRIDSKEQ